MITRTDGHPLLGLVAISVKLQKMLSEMCASRKCPLLPKGSTLDFQLFCEPTFLKLSLPKAGLLQNTPRGLKSQNELFKGKYE